jgi:hypothetical protein
MHTDSQQCQRTYPYHLNPRMVAGGPVTDDVFKCALKAVDPADYQPRLSAAQLAAVKAAFPNGVCDFSKAPVGDWPLVSTWLSYPFPGSYVSTQ